MPPNASPKAVGTKLADALRLHKNGDLDDAIRIYRKLIEDDPENADAWHLLGTAAYQRGDLPLARELIENAIRLRGDVGDFHNNLGLVLRAGGSEAGAERAFAAALECDPHHANALLNMTGLLRRRGDALAAVIYGERAVAAAPADPEAQTNYGNALKDTGQLEEAIEIFRGVIAQQPEDARSHWNLALALLLSGDLAEGFAEYAWRWHWDGFPSEQRSFEQPMWRGEDLAGRTILLHAEQGLGDAVQFVRYAPLVADRGGRVIVEASEKLAPLFTHAQLADQVVAKGDPLPDFDLQAAFLDLPRILKTTFVTIPAPDTYLSIPTDRHAAWREKLSVQPGLKVGINSAGNDENPAERARRLDLEAFSALGKIPDIVFYNLQKGPDAADLPTPPTALRMIETGEDTLTETAAMIANLDLVITSDTVTAHLAAALGIPTWVLLPYVPDWRWLMARDDSPWYPTAHLFRQPNAGDWPAVALAVETALRRFVAGQR